MKTRKIGGIIFGTVTLIIIGFTIYRITMGKDVGFNEIVSIAIALSMFFSTITWGTKKDKDGIFQDEELGRMITEKSSKISYFVLTALILVATFADELINGTVNLFLLVLLGLSIVILPFVEFLVARKYE
jgi:hypothetical protein